MESKEDGGRAPVNDEEVLAIRQRRRETSIQALNLAVCVLYEGGSDLEVMRLILIQKVYALRLAGPDVLTSEEICYYNAAVARLQLLKSCSEEE